MKAAIRLEITKKDETQFLEKVNMCSTFPNNTNESTQTLITFYRTQLHRVFKMGLNANHPPELLEE